MRKKIINLILVISLLNMYGCKKDMLTAEPPAVIQNTKFKFFLYTTHTFSDSLNVVNFRLYIRNNDNVLLDSPIVTICVKDVPGAVNKLYYEKNITGNYQGIFTVGFTYTIPNVGQSWYLDTCRAGAVQKIIDYNFR